MATAFSYALTYAGIPFVSDDGQAYRAPPAQGLEPQEKRLSQVRRQQSLEELIEEIDRQFPLRYVNDIALPPSYPGYNLSAIASAQTIGPDPSGVHIGEYYYPVGATRFSVFRGLATSTQVKAMLAATTQTKAVGPSQWPSGTNPIRYAAGSIPATFVMEDVPSGASNTGTYTLATSLYMLPPRTIGETGGDMDGLFLVTLVDERYWWQFAPTSAFVGTSLFPTLATWQGYLDNIALALGVDISFSGPIADNYTGPEPDSQLWINMENCGVLLDAVAYNLGCHVVRNLDGTYTLQRPEDAVTTVVSNRGVAENVVRTAGGDIFNSGKQLLPAGDRTAARNAAVPGSVNITTPLYCPNDEPVPHFLNPRTVTPQRPSAWYETVYGDIWIQNVPIASGGPLVSGLIGTVAASGTLGMDPHLEGPQFGHAIHTTAKALVPEDGSLSLMNQSGIVALSMQIAQDYFVWQAGTGLDEVYPGTLVWTPEGFHDIVWTYSPKRGLSSCRVMRTQWNTIVREMQHTTPPQSSEHSSVPRGVGGKSVAQTWRDSYTFGGALASQIQTTISYPLATSGTFAVLESVAFLPTQNRWKAQIDNEVVLFEGTSGGIWYGTDISGTLGFYASGSFGPDHSGQVVSGFGFAVDFAQNNINAQGATLYARGIDGTWQSGHIVGAPVTYLGPNTTYGVNVQTIEKGQFAHPSDWGEGIQGVNILPQIQTVQTLSNVPCLINNVKHYSGHVMVYDTTTDEFNSLEYIWIVERNGLPVNNLTDYEGQLAGYSSDQIIQVPVPTTTTLYPMGCLSTTTPKPTTTTTPVPVVAPVYLINECCATTTTSKQPTSSVSTTLAPCTGTCRWTYTISNGWQLFSSSCCTNCTCINPTYCGTKDEECTQTGCVSGVPPDGPICTTTTSTTSTTCNPNTTTTTTTVSPTCTTCTWYWNGLLWAILNNGCSSSVNCFCPYPSFLPGAGTAAGCDEATLPCVTTTTPPPSPCTGDCSWMWVEPSPGGPGQWALIQAGCTCGPCATFCVCQPPSYAAVTCGTITHTPCTYESATTPAPTTAPPLPCGMVTTTSTTTEPSCGGACIYQWDGSKWIQMSNGCTGTDSTCGCVQPFYNGQATCETASIPCASGSSTSTTSSGSTSTTTTSAPCGTCTYETSNGVSWTDIVNNCTGGCACGPPPEPTPPFGISQATVNCQTTTTTTAPCTGSCTYTVVTCSGRPTWILSSSSCAGTGCGCCNYADGTFGGLCPQATTVGQVCQTNCINTSSGFPCATTTTTGLPAGDCSWIGGGVSSTGQPIWILCSMGCGAGYQCSPPTSNPELVGCCLQYQWTPCVATTTTSTTTTAGGGTTTTTGHPLICGTCTFTWNASLQAWFVGTVACKGVCSCTAPGFKGTVDGQQVTTNCA